jgi:hypothetical protein
LEKNSDEAKIDEKEFWKDKIDISELNNYLSLT